MMLPPYIIEEIRRREEDHARRQKWPLVELPLEDNPGTAPHEPEPEPEQEDTPQVDYRI